MSGSGANVLVVGGGQFAHDLTQRLISLDAAVEVVRVQRSLPEMPPSARVRVLANKAYPAEWVGEQVLAQPFDAVVVASSAVSPYVHDRSTGWAHLRSTLPFGLLAPLQTKTLFTVAEALSSLGSTRPPFVNACYPDVTNQLAGLHAQAPDWGLGNGHCLASFLSAQEGQTIVAVGHHWHLHTPPDDAEEMMAWNAAGEVQTNLRQRLLPLRTWSQESRNRYAARAAAEQLYSALQGESVLTSVTAPMNVGGTIPGHLRGFDVQGLEDRYSDPVLVQSRLDGWTRREGLAVNRSKGEVEFVGELQVFFQSVFGSSVFHITEWQELTEQMERLVAQDVGIPSPLVKSAEV